MVGRAGDKAQIDAAIKCGGCIGTTLVTLITTLCLVLRPSEPKCYISTFMAPTLINTTTNNAIANSAITLLVEFDNVNNNVGVQYDNVNITVGVFLDRNTTTPFGSSTIKGFYQGHQKTAKKWTSVEVLAGALNRIAKVDGKTYFRVDFSTSVKYKIAASYTRRHRLWGGANVAVNDAGSKDEKDNIRLGHYFPVIVPSGATPITAGYYGMLLLLGLLLHVVVLGLFL